MLTVQQNAILKQISVDLGINWKWLYWLIFFESRWIPKKVNPKYGNAGLLQFSNGTAKGLGYSSARDLINKNPTIEMQLQGPVKEYLDAYKPFTSMRDLASIIFVPKYRGHWNEQLPRKIAKANGVNTVGEYVDKVTKAMIEISEE